MLPLLIGVLIGVGLPIQTSVNARLRRSVGSPFLASLVSFGAGTTFLVVVTLIGRHTLLFPSALLTSQPVWLWLGGVFGVIYLTGNILLLPKLGAVQTVIVPVFGQVLMGLLIDDFGWFHSRLAPLTAIRVLGALLVLLGVVGTVAAGERRRSAVRGPAPRDGRGHRGRLLWPWRILGLAAGMFSAAQTAVNGHLGAVLGSKLEAALVSFVVGTIALIVVVAITHPRLVLTRPDAAPNPWWMWVGGPIGALFVLGNVYLVTAVGTGLAVIIVLIGMMAGSLVIDQFGWFHLPRRPIRLAQLASLLVMIGGSALIRLA
jgi:transporter family-2 protein